MPFNTAGVFQFSSTAELPVEAGQVIRPAPYNTIMADLAAALSKCLLRTGNSPLQADLDFAGYGLLNNGKTIELPDTLGQTKAARQSMVQIIQKLTATGNLDLLLTNAVWWINTLTPVTDNAPAGQGILSVQTLDGRIVQTFTTAGADFTRSLIAPATTWPAWERVEYVDGIVSTPEYPTSAEAVAKAFTDNALLIGNNTPLKKPYALGDDFQANCNWAAQSHYLGKDGSLTIEVADGLHPLNTYVDVIGRSVSIAGRTTPTLHTITGIAFTLVSAPTYNVTVTVSTALGAHVVIGYPVGLQNVRGDGGAESINGAHKITAIAGDRLSFSFSYRARGVLPTAVTTINTTTSQGLFASRVVVPFAALSLDPLGWDGGAREGFMNALAGGRINLRHIGIAYTGVTDEHDILFASGGGSYIELSDYVVIAGTGDKVLRASAGARIFANRSCLGAGTTGQEVFQGVAGGNANFSRCTMAGGSASALTASANCQIFATQCIIAGSAGAALRTTYQDSSIVYVTGRITNCTLALQPTQGTINVDTDVTIQNCTTPVSVSNGVLLGDPVFTANTNPLPTADALAPQGGAWVKNLQVPYNPADYKVIRGYFAAGAQTIPALSFVDINFALTGAAFDDNVLYSRGNNAEPAQTVVFNAFVSAVNQVTLRMHNYSAAVVNTAAFTAIMTVRRST